MSASVCTGRNSAFHYLPESWAEMNLAIPVAALVLIFLAWIAPTTGRQSLAVWESVTHPLDKVRQNLSNAIAGLRSNNQRKIVEFYGDTLSLGQRASSGDNIFLRISVPLKGEPDRFYWRVRTYDQYLDGRWQSIFSFNEKFTPDQPSLPLVDSHGPYMNLLFLPLRQIWQCWSLLLIRSGSAGIPN